MDADQSLVFSDSMSWLFYCRQVDTYCSSEIPCLILTPIWDWYWGWMNKTIGSTMTVWHEYLIGNRKGQFKGRVFGRRGWFISVQLDGYWSALVDLVDVSIELNVITMPESNRLVSFTIKHWDYKPLITAHASLNHLVLHKIRVKTQAIYLQICPKALQGTTQTSSLITNYSSTFYYWRGFKSLKLIFQILDYISMSRLCFHLSHILQHHPA